VVLEVAPELRHCFLAGIDRRVDLLELRRDLLLGFLIVGPHGAGGEHRGGKGGEQEIELGHDETF
jgi:hypothetical protein